MEVEVSRMTEFGMLYYTANSWQFISYTFHLIHQFLCILRSLLLSLSKTPVVSITYHCGLRYHYCAEDNKQLLLFLLLEL